MTPSVYLAQTGISGARCQTVTPTGDDLRTPISGGDVGERIKAARLRRGWRKVDLANALEINWRALHKWEIGSQRPNRESLIKLAKALEVSIEELLGVAEGQDPPFPAWHEFLATELGKTVTPEERLSLQSMRWLPGTAPNVALYTTGLLMLRSAGPRSVTPPDPKTP